MGGTHEGAKKTAARLLAKDPDYYKKLRAKHKKPTGGLHSSAGFDKDPARARLAGSKGGKASKRKKATTPTPDQVRDDTRSI